MNKVTVKNMNSGLHSKWNSIERLEIINEDFDLFADRKFLGIEVNKKYLDISREHLEEL